jgi:hypothetical protein
LLVIFVLPITAFQIQWQCAAFSFTDLSSCAGSAAMGWVHSMNERVADSVVGRYFELKGRKTTFSTGWDKLQQIRAFHHCPGSFMGATAVELSI